MLEKVDITRTEQLEVTFRAYDGESAMQELELEGELLQQANNLLDFGSENVRSENLRKLDLAEQEKVKAEQAKQQAEQAKQQAEADKVIVIQEKNDAVREKDVAIIEKDQAVEAKQVAILQVAARDQFIADLLIKAELPEEVYQELLSIYSEWSPESVSYKENDPVIYNKKLYFCIQAHTSQAGWNPEEAPALWKSGEPESVVAEWEEPTNAETAYNKGDLVMYQGKMYRSTINANTWSPVAYPQGWELVEGETEEPTES